MCEYCGPDDPEHPVSPEHIKAMRERTQRRASARDMTVDQMLKSFEGPRQQRFLTGPPRFLQR